RIGRIQNGPDGPAAVGCIDQRREGCVGIEAFTFSEAHAHPFFKLLPLPKGRRIGSDKKEEETVRPASAAECEKRKRAYLHDGQLLGSEIGLGRRGIKLS